MTANNNVTPIPLLVSSIRLVAVPTAVAVSRMFVRHTLEQWHFEEHIDVATLIMSELATNAIKATGITSPQPKSWQITDEHVVAMQLRALGASLYVEVWDRSGGDPVRKNPDLEATNGRGLLLVDVLSKRRSIYRPPVGGKIVWAELPLGVPLESPPLKPVHRPLLLGPGIRAPRGPVENQARTALFDWLTKTTIDSELSSRVNDAT
ncbi:ATP-binding protein [Streptomyces sp. cg40]|uniref:ATP-binding protein n=1 Tax=Streptomyces sp. cg40 TaxID=3419764 RepID=UPI003CFD6A07